MQELDTTKAELREVKCENEQLEDRWKDTVLREGAKEAEIKKLERQNSSMSQEATEDAARISQLERELSQEKEKVTANDDAQRQLEHVKNHWSSMTSMLSNGTSAQVAHTAPRTSLPPNFRTVRLQSNEASSQEAPPPYRPVEDYPVPRRPASPPARRPGRPPPRRSNGPPRRPDPPRRGGFIGHMVLAPRQPSPMRAPRVNRWDIAQKL
jgi:hypothetical protein